jgi:hypothetical protein
MAKTSKTVKSRKENRDQREQAMPARAVARTGGRACRPVMNKPILVLILGCLPLAGLTVASFAGIGNLASELPSIDEGELVPPGATLVVPSATDFGGDEILRAAVAEREFLAGELLPELAGQSEPLYFESLVADWKQWSNATKLVNDVLSLEEGNPDEADLPQVKAAIDQIDSIQDECRKRDPAGSARLARVLDRRKKELLARIDFLNECKTADRLIAAAKAAYDVGEYSASYKKYETVLTQHASVLSPSRLDSITDSRQKAAFWWDAGNLRLTAPPSDRPSQQHESLVNFLEKYRGMEGAAEVEKLGNAELKLESVRAELLRLEMNSSAVQPISTLDRYDERPFGEGLSAAARIAEAYPTAWVRSQLQERVLLWLAQALPHKDLDEPSGIQEVETLSGNILRGYFEPVPDAGGGVIGYKRYPTAEERKNPTRTVGRYPAADLRGVPNLSVPRQCVDAYESARTRLLADPGNRDCWMSLRRTCDSAEATLVDYRRKPGGSSGALSFNDVSRFAKSVLMPDAWSQMETIWKE